jgi:hypothetical protein
VFSLLYLLLVAGTAFAIFVPYLSIGESLHYSGVCSLHSMILQECQAQLDGGDPGKRKIMLVEGIDLR